MEQPLPTLTLDRTCIDAILFDLDGTLIALRSPLAKAMPPVGLVAIWQYWQQKLMRRLAIHAPAPLLLGLTLLDRISAFPWVARLIENLQHMGGIATIDASKPISADLSPVMSLARRYKLGVLTNRNEQSAYSFLQRYELLNHFGAITTRQNVRRAKPHPESLRYTAARLGVAPERVLMVGDTPLDVMVSRQVGAQSVGVLTGFATEHELRQAGATVVLPSVCALPQLLQAV